MEGTLPHGVYRPADYGCTKRLPIPTPVRRKAGSSDLRIGETVLIGVLATLLPRSAPRFQPSLFADQAIGWARKTGVEQLESRLCEGHINPVHFGNCPKSPEQQVLSTHLCRCR